METICPHQAQEATIRAQLDHKAHWREDGTCSYCGSIREEVFFDAIAAGERLRPTDKNYKAYIEIPDPNVGKMRVVSAANYLPDNGEWFHVTPESLADLPAAAIEDMGKWIQVAPHGEKQTAKFYFQHLSEAGRVKLIELVNMKAINFAYPGYFYVRPFFTAVA